MKVSGIIKRIDDLETVGEKQFKKRTFSIEINPEQQYPELALMECGGDKGITELDGVQVGDKVEVDFTFKGRDWEKNGKVTTFNCLSVWKITKQMSGKSDQDIPF